MQAAELASALPVGPCGVTALAVCSEVAAEAAAVTLDSHSLKIPPIAQQSLENGSKGCDTPDLAAKKSVFRD